MKKSVVLVIGIILLGGCCLLGAGFFIVTYHPCGWLDSFLSFTGCTRQLDITGFYGGTFSNDLTMFIADDAATYNINMWELNEEKLLHTIPGHVGVFSPDGAFFVVGSLDTLTIWRIEDWTLLNTLDTSTKSIEHLAVAPDLNSLAMVFREAHSPRWEIEILPTSLGATPHKLEGHSDYISTIAYSPDGTILASGSKDRTVRLWQVEDGRWLKTLKGHNTVVEKVIFAPNGQTLASADWDGIIRIWRTDEGKLLHTLEGGNRIVYDMAYSPRDAILASTGSAGLVQLWDTNSGTLICNLRHNWTGRRIEAVAFSPDGKVLSTAQVYGPVRFFNVQQLLRR